MKRKTLLKFILSFAILLAVVFSAVGCQFVDFSGGTSGGNSNPSGGNSEPSQQTYETPSTLPNSMTEAAGVDINAYFTAIPREDEPMSVVQTVERVKRSSVAIYITVGSESAAGSGTIVDISGGLSANEFYILTCNHVIKENAMITVHVADTNYRFGENRNYVFTGTIGGAIEENQAVSLIGGDKETDVAVLKLYVADQAVCTDIKNNCKAKIMDERYSLSLGEEVIAIGNSTGEHPGSVKKGVVSYLYRYGAVEDIGNMYLIQHDVATNPGNSGGGLYNLYGELVGITNSGYTTYDGLTFSIPHVVPTAISGENTGFINIAKQLIGSYNKMKNNYGYVSGHYVKFGFVSVYSDGKIIINEVTSGGLAATAGLMVSDVIKSARKNGITTTFSSYEEWTQFMANVAIGETINITYERTYNFGPVKKTETETTGDLTKVQFYFADTGDYTTVD